MELVNIIFLAMSFALALGASWVLLIPFFEEASTTRISGSDREMRFADLVEKKEKALSALEDLEQDRISDLVADDVYEESKVELQREAASCIAQLDAMSQTSTDVKKSD
jgi:hypothetical protein